MASSRSLFLVILVALTAVPALAGSRAQLRFLSFTIRDQSPTVEEAKAFRAGETTLEALVDLWLAAPGHKQRIKRYFRDMFGVAREVETVMDAFSLRSTGENGYLYRWRGRDNAICDGGTPVDAEAWWLPAGQTVKVCSLEVSDSLSYEDKSGKRTACTADRVWSGACGCGPKLIACLPPDLQRPLVDAVTEEFPERALRAYEADGSWLDVFAGDQFYGTKLLYWKYLHSSKIARGGLLPSEAEWATLASLTMDEWKPAPYPDGTTRAGLVTSPGFLLQRNEYRVRTRALSEKLLCQGIGPALNTGGIAVFLNPDFRPEDLSHADQDDCARCHYPMDNLGSMLFGWNTLGEWDPLKTPSQIGHAFGIDGEGPRFLARSFIERGPGFVECMARTAWEDFSGSKWEELVETERQALAALAGRGPRALIHTLLRSTLLANLGVESEEAPPEVASTLPWTDVAPLVKEACGGANCHANGSFNTTYVDNEKNFREKGSAIAARINATASARMPPPTSARQLTDAERALLLKFLGRTP